MLEDVIATGVLVRGRGGWCSCPPFFRHTVFVNVNISYLPPRRFFLQWSPPAQTLFILREGIQKPSEAKEETQRMRGLHSTSRWDDARGAWAKKIFDREIYLRPIKRQRGGYNRLRPSGTLPTTLPIAVCEAFDVSPCVSPSFILKKNQNEPPARDVHMTPVARWRCRSQQEKRCRYSQHGRRSHRRPAARP